MGMNPRSKKRPLQPTQLTERATAIAFINPLAQKETISLSKQFSSDLSEQNWYGLQHLSSYAGLGCDAGYNNKTYKENKPCDSYSYDNVSRNLWKIWALIGSKNPLSFCQHRNNPIHHPPRFLPLIFPLTSTIFIPFVFYMQMSPPSPSSQQQISKPMKGGETKGSIPSV